MQLTASNVHHVVKECLFSDEEIAATGREVAEGKAVVVEGVITKFGFNPEKLEKYGEDITSMLLQLPEPFRRSKGGGWSFLNACMDAHDTHWGEHKDIDELMCLGLAVKKVSLVSKDMWPMLPGGMPYFVVEG